MKAINKKNQTLVNRTVKHLIKHNELNSLRDIADGDGDQKLYNKLDKQCQNAFDKFLECIEELPKNQQKAIYTSSLY